MALSFRSLLKVATATALLAIPRAVLADTSLGCVAVSSTFQTMVSAVDNSPDTCKATCSKGGNSYYGVSQQFCVCSKTMPTISKTYDSSACNFACSAPNQAQTCGGEDSSTFQFLYNLYEIGGGSGSSAASAASSTAPSTTGTPATPSSSGASASIPADTSSTTPASSSTVSSPTDGTSITVTGSSATSGSAVHGIPQLTSTTEETRVFISTVDCSCTKSSATKAGNTHAVVTSTTEVIETVSCSGGETNPGSQCTNSLITSTIVRTTTLHSSSSVTLHSAQASASSIPPVSRPSPISVSSSIPPISLPSPISVSTSVPPVSLPSPISVSNHSTFSSSESSRPLLSSDFIEPSSSVPGNSRTPSTTTAAMSTHTTSSAVVVPQNNNYNGPYRNTTMVTAKPVSPTVSSTSPHAGVSNKPSMVVTAAGLRTFDQVSLMSKEWYLTLAALTVAFILL
ncbi:hypothetical protein SPBR_02515 [Sporothrix brasiliensis 5110]|uniref:WSC domain-containing protein n=1 Tax=Sporothrix brasiliensis 5110 TaxID=1398154 RepID=A0A0C2J5I5_9PEZI|nr:uncharacterized protein SPBR_02515 [Sporothrix brasiliensis 5110]KIH92317.1 hypothetical protein SPBR_02515 [Sporothrix brasiliensis 5110]